MKTVKFFAVVLAAAAVSLTACKKDDPKGPDLDALPNGFYVAEQGADLAEVNAMDQGINEVDQSARQGMYEKYIILEPGKKYEFVNKKGDVRDHYGVENLEYGDSLIVTDNKNIAGYKGSLAQGAIVEVKEKALYHIVLDFDEDKLLEDVGGAQCIIVPVELGMRGGFIDPNWGVTKGADKVEGNQYVWENITVEKKDGFKFMHNDAWKIQLDVAGLVKANTNLGADCVPGGGNIEVLRGIYTVTLEFVGAAATTQESFKYNVTKTEELPIEDPKTFVVGLSGDVVACGWNDPSGDALAVLNEAECKVSDEETKAGTYVYDIDNVAMTVAKDGFKVRYYGGWHGADSKILTIEGETFGGTGNFTISADAHYRVKITAEWDGQQATSLKAVFTKL